MGKRFNSIGERTSPEGKKYKVNVIYPNIEETSEDIYVITQSGDRYDTLAQQFYKEPELWWIISSANNYHKGSLNIPAGVQLRIPASKSRAIQNFKEVNKKR